MFYSIQIQGHLDSGWSEWFEGMTITTLESGDSVLTGDVVDQAALFGLLIKLRDLGLPLVAVNPCSPDALAVFSEALRDEVATHREKSAPPAPRVGATPVTDQQRRNQ